MRALTGLFVAALFAALISCSSHREVQSASSFSRDSVAVAASTRSLTVSDSVFRNTVLMFDTLEVQVERPAYQDSPPQSLRMRAVRGRLSDSRRETRDLAEVSQQRDSTATASDSHERKDSSSDSVAASKPPDLTVFLCFLAFIVVSVFLFLLWRRR